MSYIHIESYLAADLYSILHPLLDTKPQRVSSLIQFKESDSIVQFLS